jgi:hypothetical protein
MYEQSRTLTSAPDSAIIDLLPRYTRAIDTTKGIVPFTTDPGVMVA